MSDLKQEAPVENKESTQSSLQDYLSLGYLYLLVLGIVKDAIFYGFLGVNIINYSNIQDVLLSPIVFLTGDTKQTLIFWVGIILFCVIFRIVSLGMKRYHIKNKDKDWYKAQKNYEKLNNYYSKENSASWLSMLPLVGLFLFSAFIGAGIGRGMKQSKKLKTGTLENTRQITFENKETLKVNLIGHNSEYLFYAAEKDTVVTIVPIRGNIKKIQNLE